MNTATRHVIFGTGAIGLATLDALRSRGETVRLVNRSGHAHVADDVEVVGGDATDPAFTTGVSAGARVIYQALGLPYNQWTSKFPALQAAVLAAAEATGARLVSMENVYMYGSLASVELLRMLGSSSSEDRHEGRMLTSVGAQVQCRAGYANSYSAAIGVRKCALAAGRGDDTVANDPGTGNYSEWRRADPDSARICRCSLHRGTRLGRNLQSVRLASGGGTRGHSAASGFRFVPQSAHREREVMPAGALGDFRLGA